MVRYTLITLLFITIAAKAQQPPSTPVFLRTDSATTFSDNEDFKIHGRGTGVVSIEDDLNLNNNDLTNVTTLSGKTVSDIPTASGTEVSGELGIWSADGVISGESETTYTSGEFLIDPSTYTTAEDKSTLTIQGNLNASAVGGTQEYNLLKGYVFETNTTGWDDRYLLNFTTESSGGLFQVELDGTTTMGTIGTGVWNGTAITIPYLDTTRQVGVTTYHYVDSLVAAGGGGVTFGLDNEIPYTNGTTDDYDYHASFHFNHSNFALNVSSLEPYSATSGLILRNNSGTEIVSIGVGSSGSTNSTWTGSLAITGDQDVDSLNLDGNTISSTHTNGDINLTPNGTGNVAIGNFTFDADATVGAGQDDYVLTYDDGSGTWGAEASGGGSSVTFGLDNEIPYTNGTTDDYDYDSDFTFDGTTFNVGTGSNGVYIEDYTINSISGRSLVINTSTGASTYSGKIVSRTSAADAGTTPVMSFYSTRGASAFSTRPVFAQYNHTTKLMQVEADGTRDYQENNAIGFNSIYFTEQAAADADIAGSGQIWVKNNTPNTAMYTDDTGVDYILNNTEVLIVSLSATTGNLATGTNIESFRMPYAATITDVRLEAGTAPTGSTIIVDINETGSTILSTKVSIDASEKTSETAATPPVISDSALADDAEITFDIDQVGSTITGSRLKIKLYVIRL